VTSVTYSNAHNLFHCDLSNQEGIMSLVFPRTQQRTDRKHRDSGFILGLVCVVLALIVASAIFAPAPLGSGITSELATIGP
jgi:hypothetical protein